MSICNRKHKRLKASTGFTLMELLIALFVFTLLSGFAFQSIKQLSKSSEVLTEEQAALSELSRFWLLIEQDILSTGGVLPVYNSAEFGRQNDNQFVLGNAAYRLAEGTLYRRAVLVGDGRMDESALLNDIELFEVACQRDDDASCDINIDRKDSSMISVALKGQADMDVKRVFPVGGANAVQKASIAQGGLSMEVFTGALQEANNLAASTPEEQAVIDVVTGL